jgi:hypothetical protein
LVDILQMISIQTHPISNRSKKGRYVLTLIFKPAQPAKRAQPAKPAKRIQPTQLTKPAN